MTEQCRFVQTGEGQCWRSAVAYGFCREHVGYAPEEQEALRVLHDKLRSAQRVMDDVGRRILTDYVMSFSPEPVPEEDCREYRNARYRYEYLNNLVFHRIPGEPLPVEVTMKEDT